MRTGQLLMRRDTTTGAVREAEILQVLGPNGGPPFRVRWLDTGHTRLLYPDGDVWTEPRTHLRVPQQPGNRSG